MVAVRHRTRRQILYVVLASVVVASPTPGQRLLPVGRDETLDVATWNIEHFGNDHLPPDDAAQFENAFEIVRQSAIDLWAIQEIDDEGDFHRLIDRLGSDWAGIVDEAGTNTRIGFIYRRNVISVLSATNPLTEHAHDFAGRPPLMLEAAVTLAGRTFPMWFITVHMKAFADPAAYERRRSAGRSLKNYIDATPLGQAPVIVLGDFNDELARSITPGRGTPYEPILADTARYRFVTRPLDDADLHTWCDTETCKRGSTIDHILITDELFAAHLSTDRYDLLDPAIGIHHYTTTTSDHLPVYARFKLPSEQRDEPSAFELTGIFPNPVRDAADISYTALNDGTITLRLFDALGRQDAFGVTHQVKAGNGIIHLNVQDRAAGTYFLQVDGGGSYAVKSFVVVR